ncbi:MAG: hypothetical protein R3B97_05805 [Dehalococcoidia bacterium]|nr:hypothetical protein [Dehalococcoidia bacterium]
MRQLIYRLDALLVLAASAGLAVAAVVSILVLAGPLEPDATALTRAFESQLEDLDALKGGEAALAFAGSIAALVLAALFGFLNLVMVGPSRTGRPVAVQAEDGTNTVIARRAAERYLQETAARVQGVSSAEAKVQTRRGTERVRMKVDLQPSPDLDVAKTAEEVRDAVTVAASERLGVPVSDVTVETTIYEPGGRGRAKTARVLPR